MALLVFWPERPGRVGLSSVHHVLMTLLPTAVLSSVHEVQGALHTVPLQLQLLAQQTAGLIMAAAEVQCALPPSKHTPCKHQATACGWPGPVGCIRFATEGAVYKLLGDHTYVPRIVIRWFNATG